MFRMFLLPKLQLCQSKSNAIPNLSTKHYKKKTRTAASASKDIDSPGMRVRISDFAVCFGQLVHSQTSSGSRFGGNTFPVSLVGAEKGHECSLSRPDCCLEEHN